MQKRQYKFSFFLNSYHSMSINLESTLLVHPHTWQLVLTLDKKTNAFVMFSEIENKIQLYISIYEGKLLNDLPAFNNFEPSTENIGEVIFSDINAFLNPDDWELLSLEISENSTRTYIIESNESNIESTFDLNRQTIKPLTLDADIVNVKSSNYEFKNAPLISPITKPNELTKSTFIENKKKILILSGKIYQKLKNLISK